MIIAGGIVTQKPVGSIVSNNPNFGQSQINAEAKAAARQASVDNLAAQMAAKHQAQQAALLAQQQAELKAQSAPTEKRWSVPFNQ